MKSFHDVALDTIQKQFAYTNVSDLITRRADVWDKHFGDISRRFVDEILDYNTCVPSALDYFWGKILKISRNFTDVGGNAFSLTDDQFREVIKIRAFGTTWQGDALSMNEFLGNLFHPRGIVYMVDSQDMTTQIFVFSFQLEPWEKYLFTTQDVLPRPAGIGTCILEIDSSTVFGFYGSNFQPFNQGTFFNGTL